MKAALTAVIAAIEAAAVALAVLAVIGIPSVLLWWLAFDLGAEPRDLASLVAALWQLTHFVPLQVEVSAQAALGLGFAPEVLSFLVSIAPLGLSLVTVALAARSGWRFAGRGGLGVWAIAGGALGFGLAAAGLGGMVGSYGVWPMWARVVVPMVAFVAPQLLAFVLRSAVDEHDWWAAAVRGVQNAVLRFAPGSAAALPDRAGEAFRLAGAALATLAGIGAVGTTIAIVFGYGDIVRVGQSLHLDLPGELMLFLLQLVLLPIAWVWAVAWFAGPGFAVGQATSVTPFETLLGPLPGLPLLGALPEGWGWAGALAPAILVACGAALGGFFSGRPVMRRATALVAILVPITAAILVGLVTMLCAALAAGSVGPGRLSEAGPVPWQVGLAVTLELAFGMSLGVFARRVDLQRLRTQVQDFVPAGRPLGDNESSSDGARAPRESVGRASVEWTTTADQAETAPLAPLRAESPSAGAVGAASVAEAVTEDLSGARAAVPLRADAETSELTPLAPQSAEPNTARADPVAVDPLLDAFAWEQPSDPKRDS